MRFMSFNIFGAGYGGFSAAEREDRAIAVVRKYAPDVISWQEVNDGWWASRLFREMSEYETVRGDEDEAMVRAGADLSMRRRNWVNHEPLMYRKDRLKLLDSGLDFYHFALQPEKSLTWAVLEDRADGRRFVAFATHFWWKKDGIVDDAVRDLNARHVISRIESVRAKWGALPVVGGGDLNCVDGSQPLATFLAGGYGDAGVLAPVRSSVPSEHGALVRDAEGRCRGRVGKVGEKGHRMIDHVLFDLGGVRALRHDVVVDEEAIHISDHSPVVVDFVLAPEASPLPATQRMRCIAHRGMWDRLVPQNTVEAIRRAYESGATWVETDFHHTKAGQMVCIHAERELKDLTGCGKKIADLTPEDVATLDLGKRDGLDRPYRIPLLDQVLAVVPRDCVLQAEIKGYTPQYADIFDAAVKSAGLTESNIVVSSFQYDALKDFKSRYPKYRTVWLTGLPRNRPFDAQDAIAKCRAANIETFCPGCGSTRNVMTRADADAIRSAGLEFRMYGVNSPADMLQARMLGATGFTCNFWRDAHAWARALGGIELLRFATPFLQESAGTRNR
jgi:glycerophosphoryl diester phosphodiesterase